MDQRTWVFIANRPLSESEESTVNDALNDFVLNWKTHGKPLNAQAFCFEHLAIVIAANESEVKASGCSIDKINHLVHSLGLTLSVDFFNRFNVLQIGQDKIWQLTKYHQDIASTCIHTNILSLNEFNKKAGK